MDYYIPLYYRHGANIRLVADAPGDAEGIDYLSTPVPPGWHYLNDEKDSYDIEWIGPPEDVPTALAALADIRNEWRTLVAKTEEVMPRD